jgi:hypothetical protein
LLPAIELMAGLLSFFLVGAKIESNVAVSHESSLRRPATQVKMARAAKVLIGHTNSAGLV